MAAVEAEREWEENVRQLQLAVSVLILPTIGKWLGRKWSYWRACLFTGVTRRRTDALSESPVYARYIQVGWKWSLFLPAGWAGAKVR